MTTSKRRIKVTPGVFRPVNSYWTTFGETLANVRTHTDGLTYRLVREGYGEDSGTTVLDGTLSECQDYIKAVWDRCERRHTMGLGWKKRR